MSRDETVYENPEDFYPERFETDPGLLDPRDFVFGAGRRCDCPASVTFSRPNNESYCLLPRRVCPGIPLAESVIWTALATLIATTRISKARDKNGEEITPSIGYGSELVS